MDCVGIPPSQFRTDYCSEGQVLQIGQFLQSVCATSLESHCQNNDLSLFISKDPSFVAMDDVITPSENIALKNCDSDEPAITKIAADKIKSDINTESNGTYIEGYAASTQVCSASSHETNIYNASSHDTDMFGHIDQTKQCSIKFGYIDIKQVSYDVTHVDAHMD